MTTFTLDLDMNLIPDEELKRQGHFNLAPLVDFLFLVLAIFATLAVTRAALYDTQLDIVKLKPEEKASSTAQKKPFITMINISITDQGNYKWITEVGEYFVDSPSKIKSELIRQQESGLLSSDKSHTQVLLHIDKNAKWEAIAQIIFAVREAGFAIHPVYSASKGRREPLTYHESNI